MIKYTLPKQWISYRSSDIQQELLEAKVAIATLNSLPLQKAWVTKLQAIEFKREIAGTSKIEGADFTEREFEAALTEDVGALKTRSQRQARAAKVAYEWIADQPEDRPIDINVINRIHEHMVRNADDDHCPPGVPRRRDENVNFGVPKHRGAEGGEECDQALEGLAKAIATSFTEHDPIIQAHAAHYHFAAMHPYLDGNGRTARALESMLLQRGGLRDTSFIALSNYYYEEKQEYLKVLSETRQAEYDLTNFIKFCLVGVKQVCDKLIAEIKTEISKALFKDTMYDMFNRLMTGKRRVIATRQVEMLKVLLEEERVSISQFLVRTNPFYSDLKNPIKAINRDLVGLFQLGTINVESGLDEESRRTDFFKINLDWPSQIDEDEFLRSLKELPTAKSFPFLNKFTRDKL